MSPMTRFHHFWGNSTLAGGLSYFDYEYRVAKDIIIPWIQTHTGLEGACVGDFGCHQGGVLQAFMDVGRIRSGIGYDLNESSIRQSPFKRNSKFRLEVKDILTLSPEEAIFDLILIRDVLEHVPDYRTMLAKANDHLVSGGSLFVSFPPYYSAFGGHQQLAAKWAKLVPYLHFLPGSLFFRLATPEDNEYMSAGDSVQDMRSVRQVRLTIAKAENAFQEMGFRPRKKEYYLLRPEFQVRYGIPALGGPFIGSMPVLREILITGVYYLLEKF